eukprot:SAG11_NODE_1387_length_5065_cov_12.530099_1_plen_182_part_00
MREGLTAREIDGEDDGSTQVRGRGREREKERKRAWMMICAVAGQHISSSTPGQRIHDRIEYLVNSRCRCSTEIVLKSCGRRRNCSVLRFGLRIVLFADAGRGGCCRCSDAGFGAFALFTSHPRAIHVFFSFLAPLVSFDTFHTSHSSLATISAPHQGVGGLLSFTWVGDARRRTSRGLAAA